MLRACPRSTRRARGAPRRAGPGPRPPAGDTWRASSSSIQSCLAEADPHEAGGGAGHEQRPDRGCRRWRRPRRRGPRPRPGRGRGARARRRRRGRTAGAAQGLLRRSRWSSGHLLAEPGQAGPHVLAGGRLGAVEPRGDLGVREVGQVRAARRRPAACRAGEPPRPTASSSSGVGRRAARGRAASPTGDRAPGRRAVVVEHLVVGDREQPAPEVLAVCAAPGRPAAPAITASWKQSGPWSGPACATQKRCRSAPWASSRCWNGGRSTTRSTLGRSRRVRSPVDDDEEQVDLARRLVADRRRCRGPCPARAESRPISTCRSSVSPGSTWRRNRTPSIPPNSGSLPA